MTSAQPREPRPLRPAPADAVPAPDVQEPGLADYVALLAGSKWLILGTAFLFVLAGIGYVWSARPQYRSDILLQVEEKEQGLGFEGISDVFAGKVPAETEMEIIRSRSLLGSVVDELQLERTVAPRKFPLIGGAISRRYMGANPRAPFLGLDSYAWGGERVSVSRLEVPEHLVGVPLTLVVGEDGRFTLGSQDEPTLVTGQVGSLAEGNGIAVWTSELRARPGTEFTVMRHAREDVIQGLQTALRISEKGKKTGILQVSLEGPDPRGIAAILDAIAHKYLRQNVERKSAEAQKTLEFLETQLPQLRSNLEEAEAALESYRATKGSVDVSLETQATLSRSVELEKALSEVEVQRSELKQRFTDSHPALVGLRDKVAQLSREKAAIEQRFKRLPQAELDSARLIRDAKVANELYVLLLNKAQELRVVKSGTIGNVRILDSAIVPKKPVSPTKGRALVLSLILGCITGVALAFVRRALTLGIEDPEAIERETGLGVYAGIPRSSTEARLSRHHARSRVLAVVDPNDVAVESFRSLRTSLQFALVDAPNRIVCVLGPAPSIGKSFASANLGCVLAESGKRVLVIDADLRKGRLHKYFGGARENGLSELISGGATAESVIRPTPMPGVDFIATGRTPPNAAGLLGSERFSALLRGLAAQYDFIVVDTPPVLAVTDAVLVARHSGVNLLVLRAGKHPMREINAALRRFEQGGVQVHGVVLNDVQARSGYGSYGGYHYQYAYSPKAPKRA